MSWFDSLMPSRIKTRNKNPSVPDGLWKKCDGCNEVLYAQDLAFNQQVCPKCGHHMRISARQRLTQLFDEACNPPTSSNSKTANATKTASPKRRKKPKNTTPWSP